MAVEGNVKRARLWNFNKILKELTPWLSKVKGFYSMNRGGVIYFPESKD